METNQLDVVVEPQYILRFNEVKTIRRNFPFYPKEKIESLVEIKFGDIFLNIQNIKRKKGKELISEIIVDCAATNKCVI